MSSLVLPNDVRNKMTDELVGRREVEKLLKLRPSTVSEWARKGKIPCVRLSPKSVRYHLPSVCEALGIKFQDAPARCSDEATDHCGP